MSLQKLFFPEYALVPISLDNNLQTRTQNLDTFFSFSKISPGIYEKTIKGLLLGEYTKQGSILEKDEKFYFLENDSFIEKIVLNLFRKGFEKKYNGNLTVTKDNFITSRKKFYEENDISDLPIFKKVQNLDVIENSFLTKGYNGMVNMVEYLKNASHENKVNAISSLFQSLNKMHEKNLIVGDPSTYIVQYVNSKAYFTNLRFARKTDNNEDYAREISQFIISASLNSSLSINKVYDIFKENYKISQNIIDGMKQVIKEDDKKVGYFSNLYRNFLSKFIFVKTWDELKNDRKEIYGLMNK
jgi:hypothetical protein